MKTVGIIAEYNPFHNGHAYHIAEAKRVSGADRAVIVMSASFVQRGEPACADKFTRAKWALDGGADLPDVFALSCAERFASGGVRILSGLGIVDSICFGSETGDAELLRSFPKDFDVNAFGAAMSSGVSYPAALSRARGASPGPNDILALEYMRAMEKHCPAIKPIAIKRSGSGYSDEALGGEFSSAAAIRNAFSSCCGETKMSPAVFDGLVRALPRSVLDEVSELMRKGLFPISLSSLSDAVLYRFRMLEPDRIKELPEVSEGLENLFSKHCADCGELSEMLGAVKSKRYTMARLKRIAMCGLLGVTEELQKRASEDRNALYARVLGVRESAKELLTEIAEKAAIPVVARSSDREVLPALACEVERISASAYAVSALGRPYEKSFEPDASHRMIVRE